MNLKSITIQSSISPSYTIPYLYAISSNIFFIFGQFIAKLQTELVSSMFIIYYRSLLMIMFNAVLIWRENRKIIERNLQQQRKQKEQRINKIFNQIEQKIPLTPQQKSRQTQITLHIFDPQSFSLILKRVSFACISMATYTMALKNIQLSIANALFQTGPVFVFFIEHFIHKIPLKKIHFLLTLLSFIGVGILLYPQQHDAVKQMVKQSGFEMVESQQSYDNPTLQASTGLLSMYYSFIQSYPYILPLISSITSACSMTYLHQMSSKKIHPLITVQYLMIGAVMFSGLVLGCFSQEEAIYIDSVDKNQDYSQNYNQTQIMGSNTPFFVSIFHPYFIISTILMTLFIFMCQYLRTKSLYMLPASKIAPLHYLGIILSILFDLFVFGYDIKWYQFIGMTLAGSGLLTKLLIQKYQV